MALKMTLLLIMLFTFDYAYADECTSLSVNSSEAGFRVYVSSSAASLWTAPKYNWKDCLPKKGIKNPPECNTRNFVTGGDELILRTHNSNLIQKTIKHPLYEEPITYSCVSFRDKNNKIKNGWVANDYITDVDWQDYRNLDQIEMCETKKNQTSELSKLMNHIEGEGRKEEVKAEKPEPQAEEKLTYGKGFKSGDALKEFMCIQRNSYLEKDKFEKTYQNFLNHSLKAEKAFDIPHQLILCTALVEGGFYHHPEEKDLDRGYFQFKIGAVEDMQKQIKNNYQDDWKKYTKSATSSFNSSSVRLSDSVEMPVAAGALYLKWLIQDRVKKSGCRDCTYNPMNEKTIFMAIAGYNWGPYRMHKYSDQSTSDLLSYNPPPEVTRKYLKRIRSCLSPDKMLTFNPGEENKSYYYSRCLDCTAQNKTKCDSYKKKEKLAY